jgi:hypothetical protein
VSADSPAVMQDNILVRFFALMCRIGTWIREQCVFIQTLTPILEFVAFPGCSVVMWVVNAVVASASMPWGKLNIRVFLCLFFSLVVWYAMNYSNPPIYNSKGRLIMEGKVIYGQSLYGLLSAIAMYCESLCDRFFQSFMSMVWLAMSLYCLWGCYDYQNHIFGRANWM